MVGQGGVQRRRRTPPTRDLEPHRFPVVRATRPRHRWAELPSQSTPQTGLTGPETEKAWRTVHLTARGLGLRTRKEVTAGDGRNHGGARVFGRFGPNTDLAPQAEMQAKCPARDG